jgi:hypothetical protein
MKPTRRKRKAARARERAHADAVRLHKIGRGRARRLERRMWSFVLRARELAAFRAVRGAGR